jgi:hypothetical protein
MLIEAAPEFYLTAAASSSPPLFTIIGLLSSTACIQWRFFSVCKKSQRQEIQTENPCPDRVLAIQEWMIAGNYSTL